MRAPRIEEDPWLQFLLDFSKRLQQKLTDTWIAHILKDFNSGKGLGNDLIHAISCHIKKNPVLKVRLPTPMWYFLNCLTSLSHNFLIWIREMVSYYLYPGLFSSLNKIMDTETVNWKAVSFHLIITEWKTDSLAGWVICPRWRKFPVLSGLLGRNFKIMGIREQSQWLIFFKPVSDFLKTSWICSLPLPGLDL